MSTQLPSKMHRVQLKELTTALFLFNTARWTDDINNKSSLLQRSLSSLSAAFQPASEHRLLSSVDQSELDGVLTGANANASTDKIIAAVERILGEPEQSLASYGTLRPGEENYWVMDGIAGDWIEGRIQGRIVKPGRYPVFIPSNDPAQSVPVLIFRSEDLTQHWKRIDEFEGPNYRRILLPVETASGLAVANVYATSAWQVI